MRVHYGKLSDMPPSVDVNTVMGTDVPEDLLEIYVGCYAADGKTPAAGTGVLTFHGSWNGVHKRLIGTVGLEAAGEVIGYNPPLMFGGCKKLFISYTGAGTQIVDVYVHRGE